MKRTYIILRTKSVGDIVIDDAYVDIYRQIDKTTQEVKNKFNLNDYQTDKKFEEVERATLGDWTRCSLADDFDKKRLEVLYE